MNLSDKANSSLQKSSANMESLLRDLPDAVEAERFFERFAAEHNQIARLFARDHGLLADALALAAWSPFLATTLLQHPEYLQWLARVKSESRVLSMEELGDALARFAATHTSLSPSVLLARFRRRELLRIYLRDIRRTASLVETIEELSNLADAVLSFALDLARQELDNLYGAPLCTDERRRTATAGFVIVALGKLGSRELNYASDIDLLFLYSDDGATSGAGERGATTNREYFVRLATRVSSIVGATSVIGGEGAAYRVDLRLRPHGRDGVLAPSVAEAVRYYREKAQPWERQALIRSRAAAGQVTLFERFNREVRDAVFRKGETVASALDHVRQGKRKIDEQHGGGGEFNVKLGQGGIREIEFIAQALQLAYGGADEWLRPGHTLLSLGRLRDRDLITETEHAALSDAYAFLRAVEHRVQMEHGLQTHRVADDDARRTMLAKRMNFKGDDALAEFDCALGLHCSAVRRTYDRVFATTEHNELAGVPAVSPRDTEAQSDESRSPSPTPQVSEQSAPLLAAAHEYSRHLILDGNEPEANRVERTIELLAASLRLTLNERRAVTYLTRVATSLAKSETSVRFTAHQLGGLVLLCGASEFFGDMIANNPRLLTRLPTEDGYDAENFGEECRKRFAACAEGQHTFGEALARLRNAWADTIIGVGAADAAGRIGFRESNRLQTLLATTSTDAACAVAARELAARYRGGQELDAPPRLAVLGLGRLGGGGMDYGSDLDLVLVFDDDLPSPLSNRTPEAAYSAFAELMIAALSSLTRDGYLYRVDLRLRPDGRNGALVVSRSSFLHYLRERAAAWELLAYVKLHPAAGDRALGDRTLAEAQQRMRAGVERIGIEHLRVETRRLRERLEQERTERRGVSERANIKFGAGGMLDVYFAARFLQLRDGISEDVGGDRSTTATLNRLRDARSLIEEDWQAFHDGYALLRRLDHFIRLILGRGTQLPPESSPALADLARCLNYSSPAALLEDLHQRMKNIRSAYNRVLN